MELNQTQTVEISVNGARTHIRAGASLLELLQSLGVQPDRVAVELDRRIVRRPDWASSTLSAGASVEVVQFVGGG